MPFYLLPLGLGLLIDAGVSYPALIVGLGGYCGWISLLMLRVARRLKARAPQV